MEISESSSGGGGQVVISVRQVEVAFTSAKQLHFLNAAREAKTSTSSCSDNEKKSLAL